MNLFKFSLTNAVTFLFLLHFVNKLFIDFIAESKITISSSNNDP